jgi:tetratricopeptide (TPR) repeat protein
MVDTGLQKVTIQQASDLALQHFTAGRMPEAENIFQQILQFDPNQPVALHRLGVISHLMGKHDIAVDLLTKSLATKPDFAAAHGALGNVFQVLGRLDESVASYQKALSIEPDFAEAHNNLGGAFQDMGRLDDAVASYHKAINIKSDYAEAHSNLGHTFKELGRLDEAVASLQKALDIKPDQAVVHCNLGAALHGLGRLDESVASCHKALAINPDYAEAHNNLGLALQGLRRLDEAVASYDKALAIKPGLAEAHSNLGHTFKELGRLDEAVASLQKALAIRPDYAEVHLNLSFALLAKGRLKEGLDEHEWRWHARKVAPRGQSFSKPMWDGASDLEGKTILLWSEQGPQDITTWSSYLPLLSARAGHCIFECPMKLVSLFSRSFPSVEIRPEDRRLDAERDDFDFHLPIGSLFRHFLPGIFECSGVKAFLSPNPDRTAVWKKRLGEIGSGPFVGISWKSPLITPRRAPNYTELSDWRPVFQNRDAIFVNLQCKNYEDDLANAQRDFGVTVHDFEDLDLYDDLDEVAALAAAVDVTISVSTAVASIAAGVGTPTWVAAWRQSSWTNVVYAPRGPSVRFFERNTRETWDGVFVSMAKSLAMRDF